VDGLKPYDDMLSRLLFDRRLREAVRAGGWSVIGEMADAFQGIDLDRLEILSGEIRGGVLRGQLGELGVAESFPDTIATLGGGPEAVADRFLAAQQAAPDMDITGRGAVVGVLEAFHTWAERELHGQPAALCRAQHELATALLATLARTTRPGFLVRWPLVHAIRGGWTCVLDAAGPLVRQQDAPEQPFVYRAAAGRLAIKPVTLTLAAAALDAASEPPSWVAEQLAQLDAQALQAARDELAALGLS
jgi:hypothetical protein